MTGWRIALLIALSTLLVLLAALGVWIGTLPEPHPGLGCATTWKWDPSCIYIEELKPDSTLSRPAAQMYLVDFKETPNAGPPVCLPMWYAYRYVRAETGEYGPMSDWTKTPVQAGGVHLPTTSCPISENTCQFNNPILGVTSDLEYAPMKTSVWANVHRYVGTVGQTNPPSETVMERESTIVGMLLPSTSRGCGVTYAVDDVLHNPCIARQCGVRCENCA